MQNKIVISLINIVFILWSVLIFPVNSNSDSRIKDIVNFEGVRDNVLARIFHEASLNQKFKCKFNIKKIISSKMINV